MHYASMFFFIPRKLEQYTDGPCSSSLDYIVSTEQQIDHAHLRCPHIRGFYLVFHQSKLGGAVISSLSVVRVEHRYGVSYSRSLLVKCYTRMFHVG